MHVGTDITPANLVNEMRSVLALQEEVVESYTKKIYSEGVVHFNLLKRQRVSFGGLIGALMQIYIDEGKCSFLL